MGTTTHQGIEITSTKIRQEGTKAKLRCITYSRGGEVLAECQQLSVGWEVRIKGLAPQKFLETREAKVFVYSILLPKGLTDREAAAIKDANETIRTGR